MSVYDKVIEAGEAIKRSQVSLEVFEAWSFEKQATWIECGAPVPVRVVDTIKGKRTTLEETEYYALQVVDDTKSSLKYQLVNLETGVVEYDGYVLYRALEALNELTQKLRQVYPRL